MNIHTLCFPLLLEGLVINWRPVLRPFLFPLVNIFLMSSLCTHKPSVCVISSRPIRFQERPSVCKDKSRGLSCAYAVLKWTLFIGGTRACMGVSETWGSHSHPKMHQCAQIRQIHVSGLPFWVMSCWKCCFRWPSYWVIGSCFFSIFFLFMVFTD